LPRDWREERRLRGWALHQQGWTGNAIAAALGVTKAAVSRWLKRAREGGVEALHSQPPPGPTPRLTADQLAQLPGLLARGAEAFGFIGEVWTAKRVAAIIRDEFDVRYHPDHVGRLLRTAGWSPQKPIRRATQRDEAAIQRWITERWPALEAKPTRRAARLSGSMSRPSIRCQQWSAPGRPGARRLCYTRHSPAITCPSSVASRPPANSSCRCGSARCAPDVVRFLQHLLRHIPGQLLIVWEGAPIHRAHVVKDFLAQGGAARIWLEQLPAYAPELNPEEGIWNYLKRVELRNVCCDDLAEFRLELRLATARVRHKRTVIQGCITECGYAG
jgi:transposase